MKASEDRSSAAVNGARTVTPAEDLTPGQDVILKHMHLTYVLP